jgi:hypothetical protein
MWLHKLEQTLSPYYYYSLKIFSGLRRRTMLESYITSEPSFYERLANGHQHPSVKGHQEEVAKKLAEFDQVLQTANSHHVESKEMMPKKDRLQIELDLMVSRRISKL